MRRGSLRQRSANSWELRVYQGVDADTGRSRYATRTVRGSRREASRQLDLLVAEIDNAAPHAGTLAELLERWFAAASPGWAPTTVAHTRSVIDCHLVPHLGHLPVAKVTTADIDDFYGHLLRSGGRDGLGLKAGTVRRVHSVLHRAMVQALRWEWIWINPASQASPPRVRRGEIRPPSPEEFSLLLDTVGDVNPALCCLLRLAATTGARRGQLLALRWGDVDLERGSIAFTRALVVGPDGPVLSATKTDRTHRVDLDEDTHRMLVEHRAACERRAEAGGTVADRGSFVFSRDPDGRRPWAPNWTPSSSSPPGAPPGYRPSAFMICATSWPPTCSPERSRSRSSPNGSTTRGPRPPSTSTPTRCPPGTATPPGCWPDCSSAAADASSSGTRSQPGPVRRGRWCAAGAAWPGWSTIAAAMEAPMVRVKTQVQLDERLLELVEQRATATGRDRDQVIEEALRRQLADDQLEDVLAAVRGRSDLTDEQALELAYRELKAMRAERRAAS